VQPLACRTKACCPVCVDLLPGDSQFGHERHAGVHPHFRSHSSRSQRFVRAVKNVVGKAEGLQLCAARNAMLVTLLKQAARQ
jgi:hypothetical protein